jgi:hypothetical protein
MQHSSSVNGGTAGCLFFFCVTTCMRRRWVARTEAILPSHPHTTDSNLLYSLAALHPLRQRFPCFVIDLSSLPNPTPRRYLVICYMPARWSPRYSECLWLWNTAIFLLPERTSLPRRFRIYSGYLCIYCDEYALCTTNDLVLNLFFLFVLHFPYEEMMKRQIHRSH